MLSEQEVKLSFYFYNIRDVFRIEGMREVFIFWGEWMLFLEQTNTSDVFKIVSRVDDKR